MKHRSLEIIRDEHSSLAAMLQSMRLMVDRGPQNDPRNFFDVLRAMLFYIDEFPERLHHPKETELLFPRVAAAAPEVGMAVARLDHDQPFPKAELGSPRGRQGTPRAHVVCPYGWLDSQTLGDADLASAEDDVSGG